MRYADELAEFPIGNRAPEFLCCLLPSIALDALAVYHEAVYVEHKSREKLFAGSSANTMILSMPCS
jgi:hypothetical protein